MEIDRWADFDPARHPFDPAGVLGVLPAVAPPLPAPAPPRPPLEPGHEQEWLRYQAADNEHLRWNIALTEALVGHYGPWVRGWYWLPRRPDQPLRWNFWVPVSTSAAESWPLIADAILEWRRWLEELAARFRKFPPDRRETAIAELLTTTAARIADADEWQGLSGIVVSWFLQAGGVPAARATELVDRALTDHFDKWIHLTAEDAAAMAAQIAGELP